MPPTHVSETDFEDPYDDGSSNGEGEDDGSALHGGHATGEIRRGPLNGEVMKEKSRAESTVSSWIGCPDDVHAVIYLRYLDLPARGVF